MKRNQAIDVILTQLQNTEHLDLPYTGSSDFIALSDQILTALEDIGMLPPSHKVIPEPSGWDVSKGAQAYKNEWESED